MDNKTLHRGHMVGPRYVVENIRRSEDVYRTSMIIRKRTENAGNSASKVAQKEVSANVLEKNINVIAIVNYGKHA